MRCLALFLLLISGCAPPVADNSSPSEVHSDSSSADVTENKSAGSSLATEFPAKVTLVRSGDTLEVLPDDLQPVRLRIAGVAAPRRGQNYARESKTALGKLIGNALVVVRTTSTGPLPDDVLVADVRMNLEFAPETGELTSSDSLSRRILQQGLAWYDTTTAPDRDDLKEAESQARKGKIGLWGNSEAPVPPWEWKRETDNSAIGPQKP